VPPDQELALEQHGGGFVRIRLPYYGHPPATRVFGTDRMASGQRQRFTWRQRARDLDGDVGVAPNERYGMGFDQPVGA